MDSTYLCAELTATCNALGYVDNDKYFKEPDCLSMYATFPSSQATHFLFINNASIYAKTSVNLSYSYIKGSH